MQLGPVVDLRLTCSACSSWHDISGHLADVRKVRWTMVGEPDDDVGECVLIHSATVFVVPESVHVREENLVGHGEETRNVPSW